MEGDELMQALPPLSSVSLLQRLPLLNKLVCSRGGLMGTRFRVMLRRAVWSLGDWGPWRIARALSMLCPAGREAGSDLRANGIARTLRRDDDVIMLGGDIVALEIVVMAMLKVNITVVARIMDAVVIMVDSVRMLHVIALGDDVTML